MREEKWKVLGEHAAFIAREESAGRANGWQLATLAAYRELKQRREDEEWLKEHQITVIYGKNDVWIDHPRIENGTNSEDLHAAIQTAKEGKK